MVVASIMDKLILVPVDRSLGVGSVVLVFYSSCGGIHDCNQETLPILGVIVDPGLAVGCRAIMVKVLDGEGLWRFGEIYELKPDLIGSIANVVLERLGDRLHLIDCQGI